MIKGLFHIATILAPTLAFAANPSANLSVQIVPPQYVPAPPVPAAAQAAGFTTLAANYDFTQPLPTGWLDCAGPLNAPPSQPPAEAWFYYNSANSCSNLSQSTDQGSLALNMPLFPSDNQNGGELDTITTFPNAYWEVVFRFQTTPDPGAAGGYNSPGSYLTLYQWYYPNPTSPSGIEQDSVEQFFGGATQYVSDGLIDWNNNAASPSFGGNTAPSNYDPRAYHTWGALLTSDGGRQGQESYLDGAKIGSAVLTFSASQQSTHRHFAKIGLLMDCVFGGLGYSSCVNAPVNKIYQCGSNICVHFSSPIGIFIGGSRNYGSLSGVNGTNGLPAAVNTVFSNVTGQSGCSNQGPGGSPECTDINLNVPWPSGATYSSGGTYNPYTRVDAWIKSLRVWSCPNWQTDKCQTSTVNP
jgi:hypothetical protein